LPVVRKAAPFRKLNGFEDGPVMNAPLYAEAPFCVVRSSCADKGRLPARAKRESTAEIVSDNRRGDADLNMVTERKRRRNLAEMYKEYTKGLLNE
jgi:hypothetical protein